MATNAPSTNRNRNHAVQQLKKGVKAIPKQDAESEIPISEDELSSLHLQASQANALLYIGDELARIADHLAPTEINIKETSVDLDIKDTLGP